MLYILGNHLALKYDCEDYTISKKEQTLGAFGLFLVLSGMLSIILSIITFL